MVTRVFRYPFEPGDLIGFSSCSALGVGINLATLGVPFYGLSHVGIIAPSPTLDGRLMLFESTMLAEKPCEIQGKRVEGVQAHRPAERMASYRGKLWHYPLRWTLPDHLASRLGMACEGWLGTSYDAIGAFRSRAVGFGWLERRLRKEDLTSIFCSEFVAAAWTHVGLMQSDNASAWNPNRLARFAVRQRITLPRRRWRPAKFRSNGQLTMDN